MKERRNEMKKVLLEGNWPPYLSKRENFERKSHL